MQIYPTQMYHPLSTLMFHCRTIPECRLPKIRCTPHLTKVYRAHWMSQSVQWSQKADGPSVQSPTTPNQYNLLRNEDTPSTDGPPTLPKCTEHTEWAKMYSVHKRQMAQVYRVLLHQTSITYWEMRTYPAQMAPQRGLPQLIDPKYTELYYTTEAFPTHCAQMYRALLH